MIDVIILNKAISEIKNRRNIARAENNMHFEEINEKIPEISEINNQLAKTSMNLLNIIKSGQNISEKMEDLKEKNIQAQKIIKNLLTIHGYPEKGTAVTSRLSGRLSANKIYV